MSPELQMLKRILKENDHSITETRQKVLRAMVGQPPMTLLELAGRLSDINRSSIYRTVSLFESISIVNRIQFGWKYKLELSDKFKPHHHHISCSSCGKIVDLPHSNKIEKLLDKLARERNFTPLAHQIEVSGTCQSCKT